MSQNLCIICENPCGLEDYCDSHAPNSTLFNRILRFPLKCSVCPPNRGENAKRRGFHGKTKPKYKTRKREHRYFVDILLSYMSKYP